MQFRLAAVAAVIVVALAGCSTSSSAASPAPSLANPAAEAQPLVERFFDLLRAKDVAGLRDYLSPAFQVARADGTGVGKDDYLTNLPTVNSFTITDLTATAAGPVLVARYLATVEGTVNGNPYTPGPAPRLSVFSWNGSAWQLAAHANFNALNG